ncbi:MAG: ABC transporter ATP-binding protein, partial [Actinobacteria bacterium]|nr:ABC transporter ATP-binding protein [Actinomycetota bacterium]
KRLENMFRRDPANLVKAGASLLFVAILAVGCGVLSPTFVLMVISFSVFFCLVGLLVPIYAVPILSLVPGTMRPHAAALIGIYTGVGGLAGSLLLGGVDTRFGSSGAILAVAIPAVIGGIIIRGAARTVNADLDRMIDEIIEEEELDQVKASGGHVPLLACRNIDFSYGQVQVLFDVSFTVDEGEMVALLGTNGAGKSTLLKVVSGLELPSKGSVRLDGTEITYLDAERRVKLGIIQIPGRGVFEPLSMVENLRLFGYAYGRDRHSITEGIDASFEAFPILEARRHQQAQTLSGGEQQMLALSKALILKPRLLVIDELSLGLAPAIVESLLAMVKRINDAGTAVVLVEQSVNIALSLVDHAYFMEKGEIRFDGRANDLLERGDLLRAVFLQGATEGLASQTS